MRIVEKYSHLNGLEYLLVHKPDRWSEIEDVINSVDADACRTKVSEEERSWGKVLYSPSAMNREFANGFEASGWEGEKKYFYVTSDSSLMSEIWDLPPDEQRKRIKDAGLEPLSTYNQTDFVKERVGVEVQFGKYSFVAHDIFVKHMSFFVTETIDVGIEIVPMKELERQMSSGVPYYERDLMNIIRQGRGVPAVPLVLVGVAP